jgi:pyruvate dehydrogenase E1 component alpha subunit
VPAAAIDGNDVHEVWHAMSAAARRARAGDGPSLVECRTYRQRGHVEAESTFLPKAYRSEAEIEQWKARDPIVLFGRYLESHEIAETGDFERVDEEVLQIVAEAVAHASDSPWPATEQATQYMFA